MQSFSFASKDEKECDGSNSDKNLIIKLENNLNSKLFKDSKLDNNSISKTKNIVSRLDSCTNNKNMIDEIIYELGYRNTINPKEEMEYETNKSRPSEKNREVWTHE